MKRNSNVLDFPDVDLVPAAHYLDPRPKLDPISLDRRCPNGFYCRDYQEGCRLWWVAKYDCLVEREDNPRSIYFVFLFRKIRDDGAVNVGRLGYGLWNASLFKRVAGKEEDLSLLDDKVVAFLQLKKRLRDISQMPANIVPRCEWAIACLVK